MAAIPTIPKIIHQSWKKKELPPRMRKCVEKLKAMNPEYTYEFSDDTDCKKFLYTHFGEIYVHAFNALRFGMFKCDLWRYAVLYVKGGVYIDIDMVPVKPLSHFIKEPFDFISPIDHNPRAIYQALIAVKPEHPAILHALRMSLYNIASRRPVLTDILVLTGPVVMGTSINLYSKNPKTTASFRPGVQDDGKMLLLIHDRHESFDESYVIDLDGTKLFRTKYKNYRNEVISTIHSLKKFFCVEDYYNDNKNESVSHIFYKIFALYIFIFGLLIAIALLIYCQM